MTQAPHNRNQPTTLKRHAPARLKSSLPFERGGPLMSDPEGPSEKKYSNLFETYSKHIHKYSKIFKNIHNNLRIFKNIRNYSKNQKKYSKIFKQIKKYSKNIQQFSKSIQK